MAHPTYLDAAGATRSRKGDGSVGTDGDPDITYVLIEGAAAGATLADNTSNPSTVSLGSYTMVYDGSAWDRWTGAVTITSGTISLPSGASSAANQATIIGHLDGVETVLGTIDTDTGAIVVSAASIDGKITACNTGAVVLSSGTVTTVTTLTGSGIAHDSADSGNPHKIGAKATAALSGATLVAAADRSDLFCGVDGVLIVRPHCNLEDIVSGTASNTDGTSTSCIAAAGSGIKIYLQSVTLSNTSSTAVEVALKSGTTEMWTYPVPANTSGVVCNFPIPLPPNAANEAWNFDPSTAATTIKCSMLGFKSKV